MILYFLSFTLSNLPFINKRIEFRFIYSSKNISYTVNKTLLKYVDFKSRIRFFKSLVSCLKRQKSYLFLRHFSVSFEL